MKPNPWDHPDWKAAARESVEESKAKLPPPIEGARNFWDACRRVDARNFRRAETARLVAKPVKPQIPQSTLDLHAWLKKFHPDQLPQFYAKRPWLKGVLK